MRAVALAALLYTFLLTTACGRDESPTPNLPGASPTEGEPLPAPTGAAGGVTGMPDRPGPGPVGPPPLEEAAVTVDAQGNPLPQDAAAPEPVPASAAMPSPEDAMAVMRDYFAAINRGDVTRAYALWGNGGQASGQSPQQFAEGLSEMSGMSVELSAPRILEAADGSRTISVPVAIVAQQRDGNQRRLAGAFVLRPEVAADAGAGQPVWRIASAQLRPADAMP